MKNWVLVLLKCNEFNTSACQEISICLALIVWSIFEENDKKKINPSESYLSFHLDKYPNT